MNIHPNLGESLRQISSLLPDGPKRSLLLDAAFIADQLERPLDDDLRAFQQKFGFHVPERPELPTFETLDLRYKLVAEEASELLNALRPDPHEPDLNHIAHEAIDLIYVCVGTLVSCGVRMGPLWRAVHAANMAKVPNPTGGKVMKPEGWRGADIPALVEAQR